LTFFLHRYQKLVDKAIKRALVHRNLKLDRGGLTPQDHFYRQISRVEDIVEGLQAVQEEAVMSDGPREVVEVVLAVNNVLVVCPCLYLLDNCRSV
jgi:nuclear pore complex protein Nup133